MVRNALKRQGTEILDRLAARADSMCALATTTRSNQQQAHVRVDLKNCHQLESVQSVGVTWTS